MNSVNKVLLVALIVLNASSTAFAFLNIPRVDNTRNVYSCESSLSVSSVDKEEVVNPRKVGLARLLDDGTRKSHSMAENTAFVTGFFKGLASLDSYKALLTSLYFVYMAMEDAMEDSLTDERVKAMDDGVLRRVPSLKKDLDYFYESTTDWKTSIQPSLATQTYVSRIRQIAQSPESSYLLLAHQYTRYLGDLFGGQMMGGMATKSLELNGDSGVAFYNFEMISDTQDYITSWYSKLNQLDLTEEQKQKIVDEANYVFDLNIAILQELEGSPLKAVWTLLLNTLKQKLNLRFS